MKSSLILIYQFANVSVCDWYLFSLKTCRWILGKVLLIHGPVWIMSLRRKHEVQPGILGHDRSNYRLGQDRFMSTRKLSKRLGFIGNQQFFQVSQLPVLGQSHKQSTPLLLVLIFMGILPHIRYHCQFSILVRVFITYEAKKQFVGF